MKHGSLFSGIGGFDLAAEWMGWENVFHCEWNEFGQKVLKYYWPKAISYEDITKTDFSIHRGEIDILTGGFPCQPYSTAGKRKGKEDERHLWPEMLRAIQQIQPTYIVGENVYGLVNWSGGLVFEEVQADLESEGYEVQPIILPAASVNAPHRRDRVWFVANSINNGNSRQSREYAKESKKERLQKRNKIQQRKEPINLRSKVESLTSNTKRSGSERKHKQEQKQRKLRGQDSGDVTNSTGSGWLQNNKEQPPKQLKQRISDWKEFPTQSPICNGDDGLSSRLDSITFPKWRSESIKAGGNAIVPQVVYQIFKALQNEGQTNN